MKVKKGYSVDTKKAIFFNGKQITDYQFTEVFRTKHGIVGFNDNSIYIIFKNDVIEKKDLTVISYDEGCEYFEVSNPKTKEKGLFKEDSSTIVPVNFDYIDYTFSKKVIFVEKNHQFGTYNFKGSATLACNFDSLRFENNCIIAEKDFKFGLFSENGRQLIPVDCQSIDSKGWPFFYVKKNYLTGLFVVKKVKKFLFSCLYKGIYYDQKHDVYFVEKNDFDQPHKATVFNSKGKAIIPLKNRTSSDFILRNEFILVHEGFNHYSAYSYEGELLVPSDEYEDIYVENGYITVKTNGKWTAFKKE